MSVAALLVPLAAFLALAAVAFFAGVPVEDPWLRQLVLAHAPPPVIAVMHWVNYVGTWRVLLPAAPLLLCFARTRRRWWLWLALLVWAPALEVVLKPVIGRPRPESPAFGFPSGHATAATVYLGALIYAVGDLRPLARRAARAAAAGLIVLVGVARVVLRAHWPSDVLGGIALGLACVVATALIAASIDRPPPGPTSPAPPSPGAPSRTPPAPG